MLSYADNNICYKCYYIYNEIHSASVEWGPDSASPVLSALGIKRCTRWTLCLQGLAWCSTEATQMPTLSRPTWGAWPFLSPFNLVWSEAAVFSSFNKQYFCLHLLYCLIWGDFWRREAEKPLFCHLETEKPLRPLWSWWGVGRIQWIWQMGCFLPVGASRDKDQKQWLESVWLLRARRESHAQRAIQQRDGWRTGTIVWSQNKESWGNQEIYEWGAAGWKNKEVVWKVCRDTLGMLTVTLNLIPALAWVCCPGHLKGSWWMDSLTLSPSLPICRVKCNFPSRESEWILSCCEL